MFPDWRARRHRADGTLQDGDMAAWRARISKFLNPKPEEVLDNLPPAKLVGIANMHNLLGLDHAIQGGVLPRNLLFFMPERRPLPLSSTHRRFLIPISDLPDAIQASTFVSYSMSIIVEMNH